MHIRPTTRHVRALLSYERTMKRSSGVTPQNRGCTASRSRAASTRRSAMQFADQLRGGALLLSFRRRVMVQDVT